jgi:HEAT repeat protein
MYKAFVALLAAAIVLPPLTLVAAPDEKEVGTLIKKLSSSDEKVRVDAATELGKIAQVKVKLVKDAIPALKEAAKSEKVRAAATQAYGYANPPADEAVPFLIEVLKSSKPAIQEAACKGLTNMVTPDVDASLKKDAVRALRDTAQKLMENKDDRGMQRLGRMMRDAANVLEGRGR